MPRVVVLGAAGQLGRDIVATAPANVDLRALARPECDVTDQAAVDSCIASFQPEVVINAAAYTAVDRAESQRDTAIAVNGIGARNAARAAHAVGALIVHVSTDYVFDGRKTAPYTPEDDTNPLNAYGRSKEIGEKEILASGANSLVLRSSWLYASHGTNFVAGMLKLMRANPVLKVVDDQIGVPTSCADLAVAIWKCVSRPEARGVLHWTNAGVCSWYDFAVAIQELALSRSMLTEKRLILPIQTREYPLPATRPAHSVLDSHRTWKILADTADHWRTALDRTLEVMQQSV